MKRKILIGMAMVAIFVATIVSMSTLLVDQPAAYGATPVTGALRAKAGTVGVTTARFVKLEAANTIVPATAVTDAVVGVCELTAVTDALTRYAPAGTQTTVTSGENIAVGDLLTTGTLGKAFVLDVDDTSTQRVAAYALTAASGADESVTVIVLASSVEQRLALGGDVTIADGKGLTVGSATGGPPLGEVEIFSATAAKGSIKIKQADDANNKITTIASNDAAANATITLPNATATLATHALAETLTTKTIDGDDNTIQDLGVAVPKVLTGSGGAAGLPFVIIFEPTEAGTQTYTVPTGKKLRVLDAYGFKMAGNGAHADDDLSLQNNDGTAANIFDTEELNAVNDKTRILFDNLDDSERDVVAADTLDLVANENAGNGCDATIYVLCVWVTP